MSRVRKFTDCLAEMNQIFICVIQYNIFSVSWTKKKKKSGMNTELNNM